jgi:hypothetical protein
MKEEQQEQELYNVSITPKDPNGIGINFEAGILLQHYNDDNSIIFVLKSPKKKIIPIKLEFTNIGNKESQKELIKEIMDLDAKDGLYDTVNDTVKELIEHGKQLEAKAKQTLYTEEQVRKVIEQSYSLGSAYRGVYSKKLENEIIQSLKQSKKD